MARNPMEGLSEEQRRQRALEMLQAKQPGGHEEPTARHAATERAAAEAEGGERTQETRRIKKRTRGASPREGTNEPTATPTRARKKSGAKASAADAEPTSTKTGRSRLRALTERVRQSKDADEATKGRPLSPRRRGKASGGLVLNDLDVHYGKIQALRQVSLEIKPGEMIALLGANGAGKSTTLKAISGLVAPSSGQILFKDADIAGLPAYDVVGRGIAHMPEGRELFPTLTVEENLRFGFYSRLKDEKSAYKEQLDRVFGLFPRLRERRGQAAGTMSGGEQQMLTAARAMMSNPRLLLVDELSLGLAPMIVSDLFNALHAINKEGTSVLIVEQFIHLALQNTKRAYVLSKGEIVLEGKSKDLADDPDLIEAYLGGEGSGDTDSENSSKNGAKKPPSNRKKAEAGRRRN